MLAKSDLSPGNHDKLQALYDKWFPGAADQGDISSIKHLVEEEPETAEPAKPFKSQPLNPEDLTTWAENKPVTEAQWKDFAGWWGDTQLTPEQEQGLYKSWFDKDAAPGAASSWFQQIFEHHSHPTEADFKAAGTPGWAHNSWAFGDKADTEWPVFAQWATKDPGLPKGTKIKQKLLIWNGLSKAEKAAILDNYAPAVPVDTTAVLSALKKAYPDSDWSQWANMGQGTLKSQVETLAKAELYPEATKVYNQYFGGDLPVPKPAPKGEKPKAKPIPVVPQSKLPDWAKNAGGSTIFSGINSTPAGAKKFTAFYRWAQSLGQGDEVYNPSGGGLSSYPPSCSRSGRHFRSTCEPRSG